MKHMLFLYRHVFFILLICILITSTVNAQTELTLRQSIEIALRNNPDIRVAEKEIYKSLHGRIRARSEQLPTVSARGNYDRSWELPEIVFSPPPGFPGANGEIRARMGVEHTIYSGVTLEQPIYTGGALSASNRMASRGVEVSEYNFSSVEQQTIANVYDAFYGILFAVKLITVANQSLESAEENLRQVERFYEEGATSRFELLRAQVQVGTLRPNVTEAKHNYELALDNLINLLGINESSGINLNGSFDRRRRTLLDEDIETLVQQAYQYRPEYQMLHTQEHMNREGIRLARSNFLPKVFFSSSMSWQALQNDISGLTGDDFTRISSSQLIIQIPLFNGFGNTAQYQQAQVELQQTQIHKENSRKLIAMEIKSLHKKLQETAEILESQEQVMEQAGEGLRLANLLYEEGAATLLEVIDAQLAYTQASISYYRAIYNFNTTSVQLERAVGILSSENI